MVEPLRTVQVEAAIGRFADVLARETGARVDELRVGYAIGCRLTTPEGSTRLRVVGGGEPGFLRHPAFSLQHERGGDAICRPIKKRVRGDVVADAIALLRQATEPVVPASRPLDDTSARRLLGAEGATLAPLLREYQRYYGSPPRAVFLPGDAAPSISYALHAPEQSLFLRAPPSFASDVWMRAYLTDLGFGVVGRFVATVPLPAAFRRRCARLRLATPFRPRLVVASPIVLSPSRWLGRVLLGELPVNVFPPYAYSFSRWRRAFGAQRAMWNDHFHALGHDMSQHVFGTHRVPLASLERLRAIARRARGRRARTAAATFFEGRLTKTCAELWNQGVLPGDFAGLFDALLPGLESELAREASVSLG